MDSPETGPRRPSLLSAWKKKAGELEAQVYALYFACRDPRVPWYVRGLALALVAYAFSPIDLIPDFIPVLGYLDDLVILPLGVLLVVKLVPDPVMADCRLKAAQHIHDARPKYRVMIAVFAVIWILVIALVAAALLK